MPTKDHSVIKKYKDLYEEKFGSKPAVSYPVCMKMIKDLLKDHSEKGLERIVELYFDDPYNEVRVFHLPTILSAWSINKYLPKIWYDPQLYSNAKELNEEIW